MPGIIKDAVVDRPGEWMETHSGRQFFPLDPRPEDICLNDIANGLALDCRYSGQGEVTRYYSVAEHSVLLSRWAMTHSSLGLWFAMAVLFHDAAEAYMNDLSRAVKRAIPQYKRIEDAISDVIGRKFGFYAYANRFHTDIKELDNAIIQTERKAIMPDSGHRWAASDWAPLSGLEIRCWSPPVAKQKFTETYEFICNEMGIIPVVD